MKHIHWILFNALNRRIIALDSRRFSIKRFIYYRIYKILAIQPKIVLRRTKFFLKDALRFGWTARQKRKSAERIIEEYRKVLGREPDLIYVNGKFLTTQSENQISIYEAVKKLEYAKTCDPKIRR